VRGFLVDTNVLSEFSKRGAPDQRVKSWLVAAVPGSLYVSVLTLAEIRRGIELLSPSKRRDQLEQWLENDLLEPFDNANVLPVTKAIAERWAALSARAHDLILVTRNVKDFEQLGVVLFNPWES